MTAKEFIRTIVNQEALPKEFPTHAHDSKFWECLGRTVATFGFLQEVLLKAIFAFTVTKKYSEAEFEKAYAKWVPKIEKSLSSPLGDLISAYEDAVCGNLSSRVENLDDLLNDLKAASKIRNVLCHASWRKPDSNGATVPFFIDRQNNVFETPIDIAFLNQLQKHVVELICVVINTVTKMGWQFPSSSAPGKVVWK